MYFNGAAFFSCSALLGKGFHCTGWAQGKHRHTEGCCAVSQTLTNHEHFGKHLPLGPAPQCCCLLRKKPVDEDRIPSTIPSAGQGFHWCQGILSAVSFFLCQAAPTREHLHCVSGAVRSSAEQFLKSWYYYSKQESTSNIYLDCRAA